MRIRATGKAFVACAAILMAGLVIVGMFAMNATLESALAPTPVTDTQAAQRGGPRLQVITTPTALRPAAHRSTVSPPAPPSATPQPSPSPSPSPGLTLTVAATAPPASPASAAPTAVLPVPSAVVTSGAPAVNASPSVVSSASPRKPDASPASTAPGQAAQTGRVHEGQNHQRHGPADAPGASK